MQRYFFQRLATAEGTAAYRSHRSGNLQGFQSRAATESPIAYSFDRVGKIYPAQMNTVFKSGVVNTECTLANKIVSEACIVASDKAPTMLGIYDTKRVAEKLLVLLHA